MILTMGPKRKIPVADGFSACPAKDSGSEECGFELGDPGQDRPGEVRAILMPMPTLRR
jgi:hypothetical protein